MSKYFDEKLSKYECGFRKRHVVQHCLKVHLGKWRISVDQGLEYGAQLSKLSKALNCLPDSLLLSKVSAYGFDMKALRFIKECLRDRKQRTKISDTYSSWEEILHGVPEGSKLGLLLLNIDLCDLFAIMNQHDIAYYADDNTPYVFCKNIDEVVKSLEEASHFILKCFSDNQFQRNTSKCNVL